MQRSGLIHSRLAHGYLLNGELEHAFSYLARGALGIVLSESARRLYCHIRDRRLGKARLPNVDFPRKYAC
ncbi:hypothetical protein PCL1606_52480 [Pseudomonas chlororaphis]|uniref:Uncharacterized protein n=1 Tax=Pseudomonas chlororaphis TaxID=587753 RepID=A0A0D5Y6R2_9PSED|nr:hypothetical protein PCL1606_52480 [Pseudomonas chlororaphis]